MILILNRNRPTLSHKLELWIKKWNRRCCHAPHVMFSWLAKQKKQHGVSKTCRTEQNTIPVWLPERGREAQGRWFPPGPKFVFTFGLNHFHVLSWSGNNTWELSSFLTVKKQLVLHTLFIHCLHIRTLPHSRSPTHALSTHTSAPPYSWKGLRHSYNNGNCRCRRPIDRTWTPSSFTEVAGVEVFWISSELCWQHLRCRQKSHSLQALQKLDGRLFCLSFQLTEDISYCYIMLLINVLNLTM